MRGVLTEGDTVAIMTVLRLRTWSTALSAQFQAIIAKQLSIANVSRNSSLMSI